MAKSGIRHIDVGDDLTKAEWKSEQSHALVHGNAFPAGPVERQLFYRDDLNTLYYYNGTAWMSADVEAHAALTTGVHWADAAGVLTFAGQSGAKAYLNADQVVPDDSLDKVLLDIEVFDIQGEFDPVTDYRFTVTKAGLYLIAGCVTWRGPPADFSYQAVVMRSGVAVLYTTVYPAAVGNLTCSLLTLLQLVAGQYIELFARQYSGVNQNVIGFGEGATWLCVQKIA